MIIVGKYIEDLEQSEWKMKVHNALKHVMGTYYVVHNQETIYSAWFFLDTHNGQTCKSVVLVKKPFNDLPEQTVWELAKSSLEAILTI